jgi:hypothetical protein
MKSPERITIALDEETAGLFKKMKEDLGMSQSELMREALKFYGKHKSLFDLSEDKQVYTHAEMLSAGEHVILDIDTGFGSRPSRPIQKEKFDFMGCKPAHAEQFKLSLQRREHPSMPEMCNLQMSRPSKSEFVLSSAQIPRSSSRWSWRRSSQAWGSWWRSRRTSPS